MKTFGFQWHITDRCNLRCAHCYQSDFSPESELPLDVLKSISDRIFGTLPDHLVDINITGGEPFAYPKLLELIEHLHDYKNLKEINIITNGTIAKESICARLNNLPRLKYLKVSLEAGDREANDAIRGSGNFDKVTGNITKLMEITGKPVVLMTTLARHNMNSIESTIELAHRLKAAGVIFERFVPLGQGTSIANGVLSASQWSDVSMNIAQCAGLDVNLDDLLPFRAYWLWTNEAHGRHLDGAHCNLGEESMALMPNGTVYPCRRLPLSIGNISKDTFDEIRKRLADFSPAAICQEEDCSGCRALAKAIKSGQK
jgi:MoaA/NifB/PqqE/SkfB family radical SAM enzyme